jgi:hypothetical protein
MEKLREVLNAHLFRSLAISIIEKRVNAFGEQLEIFPFPQSALRQADEDAYVWGRKCFSCLKNQSVIERSNNDDCFCNFC